MGIFSKIHNEFRVSTQTPDLWFFHSDADRGRTGVKKAKILTHILALLAAGCCEVSSVFFLTKFQKSFGVKKVANFLILVANFAISLWLLSYAMQTIAMSVAYAIWTGIGAIGAVVVGVVFEGEKINFKKALFLALIIFSVIMLKIV